MGGELSTDTILFICSIILCIVGVLTFARSITNKAESEGILVQKIDQAITGIEELKGEVKDISSNHQSLALMVNSHEQQIKTLFNLVHTETNNGQILGDIDKSIKELVKIIGKEDSN